MSEQPPAPNADRAVTDVLGVLPGVALLTAAALLAWRVAPALPFLDALLIAILIGFLLANGTGIPGWADRGVRSHKVFLGAAIVLMGASLSLDRVARSGLVVVLAVVCVCAVTLISVEVSSRNVFGIDGELASLLAAGSSICGVSAVVAVAGSIRARDQHVIYAAATILLFDAVTLVAYPVIGDWLSIPGDVFGVWAGVSMFSTGPVIAAGFAHSDTAGQWATLTKLTRNSLIGVVAVGYAAYYTRRQLGTGGAADETGSLRELWDRFPKYVVGFVGLMVLASAGALTTREVQSIENAYNWLFLLAFAGLGTEIRVGKLRRAGLAPVLVVLSTLCAVSALSLGVLLVVMN